MNKPIKTTYAVEFCVNHDANQWTLDQENHSGSWRTPVYDDEGAAQARADRLNEIFTKTEHRVVELTPEEVAEISNAKSVKGERP